MSSTGKTWFQKIKDTRAGHSVSILAAERITLADPKWRRWASSQVVTNDQCLKYAKSHIRRHGDNALFKLEDRQMIFANRPE